MDDIDISEPLPVWAARKSDGNVMVPLTQLCTRDGRRMGNAVVLHVEHREGLGEVAAIETDMGNRFKMTESEIREYFHDPIYVLHNPPSQDRMLNLLEHGPE